MGPYPAALVDPLDSPWPTHTTCASEVGGVWAHTLLLLQTPWPAPGQPTPCTSPCQGTTPYTAASGAHLLLSKA